MSGTGEERRRADRAQQVALFRYQLIREAADPALSTRQRGRLARELASRAHPGPFGDPVSVSRATIDRWIRGWRTGGFDALVPPPRQVMPRTDAETLELAAALKREKPGRTAAQVERVLRAHCGWSPSVRTLQRHFERLELAARPDGSAPVTFGRFEAARPNELWTGDALHGPHVAGRKTFLFAFLDDHSRAVMAARWGYFEDTVRLAAALRPALAARGIPESIYVDNGSAVVDAWLLRACAVLGIKLVHSRPRRPQGRGKVERFFRTVRDQFLVEITSDDRQAGTRAADLAELNRLFSAWVAVSYHRAVHSQTSQAPLARWAAGVPDPLPLPSPAQLHEAFRWSERRTVRKTATVSLHGNLYQVDASLVRRVVELVFDPFDLTDIDVRHKGRPAGKAVPFLIGRHRHAKTRTGDDQQQRAEPEPTGIDYLNILDQAHGAGLQAQINYAALIDSADDTGRPGGQEEPRA